MAQVIKFYKNANEQDIVLNLSFQNNTNNSIENINDDIFTFDSKPTEIISVEFNMTLNLDVFNDIAPFEEVDPELSCKYYLSFVSDTSRQRGYVEFKEIENTQTLKKLYCRFDIDPTIFFGSIDFQGLLVRNKEFREKKGYLTSKYSILGSSLKKRIYVDPYEKFDGSDMKLGFDKIDRPNALYQCVHTNPPKINLNKDAPESLKELFRYKGSGNARAAVRDAMFRPIAVDVWEQLARKAIEKMTPTEDSDDAEVLYPEHLEFPYNRIANIIAKACYGGSQSSAIDKLVDDIRVQKRRLKLINEVLPLVVQEVADLSDIYSKTSKRWRS
jgi:hypothetical protein